MSKLMDIVKQKVVFKFARNDALWYQTEDGHFCFPVPFSEVDGATFLPSDKGLFYMRWIRKELAAQAESVLAEASN